MLSIARALDVSLRSLHRRLVDEGQSYTAIANEASANVAKRLLADEHLTIQEAASAMGFCDATSFHRAFKRWTGTTPTKFRAHW
jgi:AraC-like DNA-binding protein